MRSILSNGSHGSGPARRVARGIRSSFFAALAAITFVLASSTASACIEGGGNLTCTDPLPIPSPWSYSVYSCNVFGSCNAPFEAGACTAYAGGFTVENGCPRCDGSLLSDANLVAAAIEGTRREANGLTRASACPANGSGSNWGITLNSSVCHNLTSSKPTLYSYGTESTEYKYVEIYTSAKDTDNPPCATAYDATLGGQTARYGQRTRLVTPTCSRLGGCEKPVDNSCPLGHPVRPGTGEKVFVETDFTSGDGALNIVRHYNSGGFYVPKGSTSPSMSAPLLPSSTLGEYWRTEFDRKLYFIANSQVVSVVAMRPDGRVRYFGANGVQVQHLAGTAAHSLTAIAGGWRLSSGINESEDYDALGKLLSVSDASGLRYSLEYDGNGRIARVVDRGGRALVFAYTGDIAKFLPGTVTVTLPTGGNIVYSIDANRSLTEVRHEDGTTVQYQHAHATYKQLITEVIDEKSARYKAIEYSADGKATASYLAPHLAGGAIGRHTFSYGIQNPYVTSAYSTTVTDPLGLPVVMTFTPQHDNGVLNIAAVSAPCTSCGLQGVKRRTYDTNGYLDLESDFKGVVTDHDFSSLGLETKRTEVVNAYGGAVCPSPSSFFENNYGSVCQVGTCWSGAPFPGSWSAAALGHSGHYACAAVPGVSGTEKRTTYTTWHATLRKPTERRTENASAVVESKQRWAYNARGQESARCEIDPTVSGAQGYVCGASANAPAGVRQTRTMYCEDADVALTNPTCPLLGLVKSVDGPRTDIADSTTYQYFSADHTGCAAAPATCQYRKGDLKKITNPRSHVVEYLKYDAAGRALSLKDANAVTSDLVYHARGWLTHRKVRGTNNAVETDDRITQIEYEPTGLVKKFIQPGGSFTLYTYDDAHRLTQVADNLGNRVVYALDNAGNRLSEETKDPGGALKRTLSRVFNQLGQLQTLADAQSNPTDFTYDVNGHPDTTTDALQTVTNQDHDPLGRLAKTLQDVGGIEADTRYEYDSRDNLRKVIDPKGLTTEYVYDGLGNLKELRSPDTGNTLYTYDVAGNRKTAVDARNITGTHTYDALNRVTAISYPTVSDKLSFFYDTRESGCHTTLENFVKGRLTRFTDPSGSTTFCFDRFGNMTRKAQVTAGPTLVTLYSYDIAGRVTQTTTPTSTLIKYSRDSAGRITQVRYRLSGQGTDSTLISNVTYLPFGPANEITYGNGRKLTRTYDQDYAIDSILSEHTGGLDLDFTTNAVDNITGLTAGSDGNVFDYDDLNRVTAVREPDQTLLQGFAYDDTGNRLSKQVGGSTQAYTYAVGDHRLATVAGAARTYSTAGSTLTAGTRSYIYNDAGRMVETLTAGVRQRQYQYNARGERVRAYKDTTTPQVLTVFDEAGHVLGEYNETAARLREYVWLDDLPVAVIAAAGVTPTIVYLEPDHLGTPRAAIDPARNVAIYKWPLLDDAFGEGAPQTNPDGDGTQFELNLRFPGQTADADTGVFYNYFRDYEPGTGRYVESDPVGLAAGVSTYGYTLGNPLAFSDSKGLNAVAGAIDIPFPATGAGAAETAGAVLGRCLGIGLGLLLHSTATSACDVLDPPPEASCPKRCGPCKTISGRIVPVGTIAFRQLDTPSRPQHGITGPHHNIYQANQNPNTCQCFWRPLGAVPPSALPPGSIPIEPFAN